MSSKRIAVVGSGPAALFAVERLAKEPLAAVDVLDRSVFPFGLVRGGQEHPALPRPPLRKRSSSGNRPNKGALPRRRRGRTRPLPRRAAQPLRRRPPRHRRALRCSARRRRRVPPPSLGLGALRRLVQRPAPARSAPPPLGPRVALVGHGNVAIDAARVLLAPRPPSRAQTSGLAQARTLAASPVREVALYGRRGAAEAKFTTPETCASSCAWRGCAPRWKAQVSRSGTNSSPASPKNTSPPRRSSAAVKGNLEALIECRDLSNASNAGDSDGTNGPNNAEAGAGEGGEEKRLRLVFGRAPTSFAPGPSGALAALHLEERAQNAEGRMAQHRTRVRRARRLRGALHRLPQRAPRGRGERRRHLPQQRRTGRSPPLGGRLVQARADRGDCRQPQGVASGPPRPSSPSWPRRETGERDGKRDDAASASGERDGTASAKLRRRRHDPRPRKIRPGGAGRPPRRAQHSHPVSWSDWLRIEKAEEARAPAERVPREIHR